MKKILFVAGICLFSQSCDNFPKDPDRTLDKVTGGTLIVGYSENPPWVVKTQGDPSGIEAELVKDFAKSLNATIQWKNGSEQSLVESLEKKEIHLLIAGITKETPWVKKAGISRPYAEQAKKEYVMAVPLGENAFLVRLEKFLHTQKPRIQAYALP